MTVHDNALPVRPAGAGFSMRYAMIVPGLGVLILGLFIGAGFLTSNPVQQTKHPSSTSSVAGTTLRAEAGVNDLAVITAAGEPPANIINAVSVPQGAVAVSHQNNSAASDQFDAQITLRSDASQGALRTFYLGTMKKQGWQIFEQGAADHDPGAIEVLGKQAGSDGFYWEMGAVISATTFGADAPPAGSTDFVVRLFQVPDPD